MATIYKRKDVEGRESWRVQLRRLGYPHFSISFDSEEEAKQWAKENEPKFLENANKYLQNQDNFRLLHNRKREIKRGKNGRNSKN